MKRSSIASFLLTCTLMLAAGAGCGGDDGDDAKSDTSGSSEEGIENADCAAITAACHDVDEGDGEANACHALAHEDDGAACKDARASCLAACK